MSQFVQVDCPVCAAPASNHVVYPDTLGHSLPVFGYKWTSEIRRCYRAVRCPKCSHIYASPRLKNIFAHYQSVADPGYIANSPLRIATAEHVLDKIADYLPQGHILDVGCSTGEFLNTAIKRRYTAIGLELSYWAAQYARAQGLNVYQRPLGELKKAHFDMISMWGVLEHLEFPSQEMVHINRLLKNEGIFAFWTGDASSVSARLLGSYWWYVMGQHIQYFTKSSIEYLMLNHGFKKIHTSIYPYVISLEYLGTSLMRYPFLVPIARSVLQHPLLGKLQIRLKLPGEMFGIYRKVHAI